MNDETLMVMINNDNGNEMIMYELICNEKW